MGGACRALAAAILLAGCASAPPEPSVPGRDEFDARRLGPQWVSPHAAGKSLWSLDERPGFLRLKGSTDGPEGAAFAFVGRRQEHARARVTTELEFSPAVEGQFAGLALRKDEENHYLLRVAGSRAVLPRAELVTRVGGVTRMVSSLPLDVGPVRLRIEAYPDRYEFAVLTRDHSVRTVGSAPAAPLSIAKVGAGQGLLVGMSASGPPPMPPADFAWFDYEPLN